jgi:hypothetical protein
MTPDTIEDLRARIAELEEELSVSDAGSAALAQRCLSLEKELLQCTATPEEEEDEEPLNPQLLRTTLLYDPGFGFTAQNVVEAAPDAYQADKHTVNAFFMLPHDACALRLDPGELPCYVSNLTLSDEQLKIRPHNGIQLDEGCYLFPHADPIFFVEGRDRFALGTQLEVSFRYYPLLPSRDDPFSPALLQSYDSLQLQLVDLTRTLQQAHERTTELETAITALTADRDYHKAMADAVQTSTSWKMTAPLRRILSILHKG